MAKGLSDIVTRHARPPPHVPWEAASQRLWENPPFLDHVGQPTDLRDAPEKRDQILHGSLSPTLAVHTHGKGTYSASYRCFDLNIIVPCSSHTHLPCNPGEDGVGTPQRQSWVCPRLASCTTVQGTCQAPTPCGGRRAGGQDRHRGPRGGHRGCGAARPRPPPGVPEPHCQRAGSLPISGHFPRRTGAGGAGSVTGRGG
jgi:hypothetical protein